MSAGILMSCYVALAGGQYDWVAGHETRDLKPGKQGQERAYFVPDNSNIMARAVETNNCRYTEPPEYAIIRQLEARKVDKIRTGNKAWCHVDGWGRQTCTYDSMEQCLKVMKRGDYCEPNADLGKDNGRKPNKELKGAK